MLHSLKVAQVGERMAAKLLPQDTSSPTKIMPAAVRLAGMAHDLGHPPFGHVAEKELQSILKDSNYKYRLPDSFEGNAQTFRILTRLSHKGSEPETGENWGMNLTAAALAASTKYPWEHGTAEESLGDEHYEPALAKYYEKKWGFYSDDAEKWQLISEKALSANSPYSINAQIMDLADDVTYAIHDVHDYYRTGYIPLQVLGGESEEFAVFDDYAITALTLKPEVHFDPAVFRQSLKWIRALPIPQRAFEDSDQDRMALHKFESAAVTNVQRATSMVDGELVVEPSVRLALEYLKELTWFYVINHPRLSGSQQGQRRIISDLHKWLCEWAQECYPEEPEHREAKARRNLRRLPARFRDAIEDSKNARRATEESRISRAAVDYISGLTDLEAVKLHGDLGGSQLMTFRHSQ